jgi:5-methylcytosine-specific restriction endonuclease McrA
MNLRKPCIHCGGTEGSITTKNGQDVASCAACGRYAYCAPRVETGREVRSLSTRPNLKPAVRFRILDQFGYTCIACGRGAPDVELRVDHIISRAAAEMAGVLDDLIDSEDNMAPLCEPCNSGKRAAFTVGTIKLMHRALIMRRDLGGGEAA